MALALGGSAAPTSAAGPGVREALVRGSRRAPSTRRFALIALGLGGRPGDRDDPSGGLAEARDELLDSLAHGHSQLEAWAALGLGLLTHGRNELGVPLDPLCSEALRHVASDARQPEELGAYAIALGLANDPAGAPVLLERLQEIEAAEAKSHPSRSASVCSATRARKRFCSRRSPARTRSPSSSSISRSAWH